MPLSLSPQQLCELIEKDTMWNGYVFAHDKGGRLIAHDYREVYGYTEIVPGKGWKMWWRSMRDGRWLKESSPTKQGAEKRLRNRISHYPPISG